MARAKEKAEREEMSIALTNVTHAGRALLRNDEQEFFRLFPVCDVSLKFSYLGIWDSKEVECDLFSAACYGVISRKKDDLARLVIEKMITKGVDLRVHLTNRSRFTILMMAAMFCGRDVVSLVLPFSDPAATASEGSTAAQLARANSMFENAELIEAYILVGSEVKIIGDDIPVPRATRKKRIDD